jgi:hypothetical protein
MNARSKGARGERELAGELSKIVGRARRTGLMQSQQDAPESDVEWLEGLVVESKRCQRVEIDKWCELNERKARGLDAISIVGWRKNRSQWRVALRLEDVPAFCRLIVEALDEEESED